MSDSPTNPALAALRRNVTGRVLSGEAEAIVEIPAPHNLSTGIVRVKGVCMKWTSGYLMPAGHPAGCTCTDSPHNLSTVAGMAHGPRRVWAITELGARLANCAFLPEHGPELDEPCVCGGTGNHDGQSVDSCDECTPLGANVPGTPRNV